MPAECHFGPRVCNYGGMPTPLMTSAKHNGIPLDHEAFIATCNGIGQNLYGLETSSRVVLDDERFLMR